MCAFDCTPLVYTPSLSLPLETRGRELSLIRC
jgi:hypothetical protein